MVSLSRLSIALVGTLLIATAPCRLLAAPPNGVMYVMDALDDDFRLELTLLFASSYANRVRMVVVSTGNSRIKFQAVQRLVRGFDPSGIIEVVEGTPTDLSRHDATRFAHAIREEAPGLITDEERKAYDRGNTPRGPGGIAHAAELDFHKSLAALPSPLVPDADLLSSPNTTPASTKILALLGKLKSGDRLDVILATAPVDLVEAIAEDTPLAKKTLGACLTMGLFRLNRDGDLAPQSFGAAPFNSIADPETLSTADLLDMYRTRGVFTDFIHIEPSTIRERSGLPGGYPNSVEELKPKLRALREKMESDPRLALVQRAAVRYRSHWLEFSGRYGHGLLPGEQWLLDSKSDMTVAGATGFYIADVSLGYLGSLSMAELGKLSTESLRVSAKRIDGRLEYSLEQKGRAIKNVLHLDGAAVFIQHYEAVMQAPPYVHDPNGFDFRAALRELESTSHEAALSSALANHPSHLSGPLVVSFKNSIDDWMALITLLADPAGRSALRLGGVICEGFAPKNMRDAVLGLLHSAEIYDVPVVAGFEYLDSEVAPFGNFSGERVLYGASQGTTAFDSLLPVFSRTREINSPTLLLDFAKENARRTGQGIQVLVLGSGLDIYRHTLTVDRSWARSVIGVYVMGGGRPKNGAPQTMEVTRNWRIGAELIYEGLEYLASSGAEVDIFSSDVFGTNLSVQLNPDGSAHDGAMKDVYNYLRDAGGGSHRWMQTLPLHWRHWSNAYVRAAIEDPSQYQPNAVPDAMITSLLGVYMSRALVEGTLHLGGGTMRAVPTDIKKKMGVGSGLVKVNWIENESGTVQAPAITEQLLASIHLLANTKGHESDANSCAKEVLQTLAKWQGTTK
jgi:hypothetical protein